MKRIVLLAMVILLVLGSCTAPFDLLSQNATALAWDVEAVDSTGLVGHFPSLVLDPANRPQIAYYDGGNCDLKYARWNGSAWIVETVDSVGDVGRFPSLKLDSMGRPRIAYRDDGNGDLKYAQWNGSGWEIEVVDAVDNTGWTPYLVLDSLERPRIAYADFAVQILKLVQWNGSAWNQEVVDTSSVVRWPSLALDGLERPHIAYLDLTNFDLKYTWWNGSAWSAEVVDSAGDVGAWPNLAFDSQERRHISYYSETDHELRHALQSNGSWEIEVVDSNGVVGMFQSLALDSMDRPHISYYSFSGHELKYAWWSGSAWIIEVVDSAGDVGEDTSLALDSNNRPHIAYHDLDKFDLKYAEVSSNVPPTASFSVTTTSGNVTTTFGVNASASFDLEDSTALLEVRWDWESDSVWDTGYTTVKSAQHQYAHPGTYSIQLDARDSGGLTNQTTQQVSVGNTPPTASFIVTPTSGNITATFASDASASYDLEDTASSLEVRWDWEDDGIWDTSWTMTKIANHVYDAVASYTIRLEVKDSDGMTGGTTRQIEVYNTPPIADFSVSPATGDTSTMRTFNASASRDLEDSSSLLEVRWDWDNDGTWDTSWSTEKVTTHQYSEPGNYTAKLEVRDSAGLATTTTRYVLVDQRGTPYSTDLPVLLLIIGIVITIVIVIGIAIILIYRRKRRTKGDDELRGE